MSVSPRTGQEARLTPVQPPEIAVLVKVVLVDINAKMVNAWRATFEENPEVDIFQGSMLDQHVSAWVSPTNARGSMDGGLDLVIKKFLGDPIEKRLQVEIAQRHQGMMPVGYATCVPTNQNLPRYLISTPTMVGSSDNVSDTLNVALACAAAFQAVHMQNAREPGSIRSVALPGLGANTGQVPVEICADLMWTGYDLFRRQEFTDFQAMRTALEERLGDLGPMTGISKKGGPPTGGPTGPNGKSQAAPPSKDDDYDFDDSE
jgi:O-acetyl-ADP-ribose deacetylase (regulator of RNase III)